MLKLKDSELGYNWSVLTELGYTSAFRVKHHCPVCGKQNYFHFYNREAINMFIKTKETIELYCKNCETSDISLSEHMLVEEYTNGG